MTGNHLLAKFLPQIAPAASGTFILFFALKEYFEVFPTAKASGKSLDVALTIFANLNGGYLEV